MYKLKEILKKANIKNSEVAEQLNIKSLSTVSLKLNGKAEFTTKEATQLKKMINERLNKDYSLEELFQE